MIPRLRERYQQEVVPKLQEEFGFKNIHQVPRMLKVVVNVGVGEAAQNPKLLEVSMTELGLITGQKACLRRAKASISNFKLREGLGIGASCTLRGPRAWEFLDRLLSVALPRVRDFKGVSPRSFDGRGNYTLGIREQIIFPEIDYDSVDEFRGMDIVVCTTATDDEQARALLTGFNFPFTK